MTTNLEELNARLVKLETEKWQIGKCDEKEITESDEVVLRSMSIFFGVCFSIVAIILLICYFSGSTGGLWWFGVFSSLAVFCFFGVFLMSLKIDRLVYKKFPVPFELIKPVELIPAHFNTEIDKIEKETIGKGSRFQNTLDQVRLIKKQTETNLYRVYSRRNERPDIAYLDALVSANKATLDRVMTIETGLCEFQAKVKAYLGECREAVTRVKEPLFDLDLVRETNRLAREVVVVEKEAWSAASTVADQLNGMTSGLRHDFGERFGATLWTVSEVETVDPHHYLEVVEATIRDFDFDQLRSNAPRLTVKTS